MDACGAIFEYFLEAFGLPKKASRNERPVIEATFEVRPSQILLEPLVEEIAGPKQVFLKTTSSTKILFSSVLPSFVTKGKFFWIV
jgi:hypothetical protein